VKRIDNKAALASLQDRAAEGHHVDSRLLREVEHGSLYSVMLEDPEMFLSLIWQESDPARFLTPPNEPRTLGDVADRFIRGEYTFASCAKPLGMPAHMHDPHWFEKCLPISNDFSYERFGPIALVSANDGERGQSPEGTFYVFDGIHKTLVLSVLCRQGKVGFKSVVAFILVPRR
jgi:hypothetical protein